MKLTEKRMQAIRDYCSLISYAYYGFDFDKHSYKNWRGTYDDYISSIGNNPETGKQYHFMYDVKNDTFKNNHI